MTCTPYKLPGGGVAIVCTKGRKPKCVTCGGAAELECDGCDKPICAQHSLSPSRNLDYCHDCTTPLKRWWLEHDGRDVANQPKSALLMHFIVWARSHVDRFPRSMASRRSA